MALGKTTDCGEVVFILRSAGGKLLLSSLSHFAHQYIRIMTIPLKNISAVILYYNSLCLNLNLKFHSTLLTGALFNIGTLNVKWLF